MTSEYDLCEQCKQGISKEVIEDIRYEIEAEINEDDGIRDNIWYQVETQVKKTILDNILLMIKEARWNDLDEKQQEALQNIILHNFH
jgi:hypothetical protein